MVNSYHTAADTFDKVNKKYLSEAAAVVNCLLYTVSNQTEVEFSRKSPEETAEMLKKFGLDTRLKKQKEWPFSVN